MSGDQSFRDVKHTWRCAALTGLVCVCSAVSQQKRGVRSGVEGKNEEDEKDEEERAEKGTGGEDAKSRKRRERKKKAKEAKKQLQHEEEREDASTEGLEVRTPCGASPLLAASGRYWMSLPMLISRLPPQQQKDEGRDLLLPQTASTAETSIVTRSPDPGPVEATPASAGGALILAEGLSSLALVEGKESATALISSAPQAMVPSASPPPTVAGPKAEEDEEAFLLENAPDDMVCPISMVLMRDPVVAPDGRTYEREALQQCIDWAQQRECRLKDP